MALVAYGNGISAMSGKLAGNVYSRTKAGPVVRNWAKPTNAPSMKQVTMRAFFAMANIHWQALTDAQREGWAMLAESVPESNRLGLPQILSGIALYQRVNQNIQNSSRNGGGPAMVNNPPGDLLQPPPPILMTSAADVSSTSITITADIANVPVGQVWLVEATSTLPATRNNISRFFRYIETVEGDEVIATRNFWASYVANFGALNAGDIFWLRIRSLFAYNGMTSPIALAKVGVVA